MRVAGFFGMSDKADRSNKSKRFRAVVSGRVQGVGFRYQTRENARRLGIGGYVRNRWNGTVEVVAEGQEHLLRHLLSWLHAGPNLARITQPR